MTLLEIKNAVRHGKTVFWKSDIYPVTMTRLKNGDEQWLIYCKENGSCIGLTWNDGETMNGKENDFRIAPYPTGTP